MTLRHALFALAIFAVLSVAAFVMLFRSFDVMDAQLDEASRALDRMHESAARMNATFDRIDRKLERDAGIP